jgi:hypothetical protein
MRNADCSNPLLLASMACPCIVLGCAGAKQEAAARLKRDGLLQDAAIWGQRQNA